jgi:hypothetical protein
MKLTLTSQQQIKDYLQHIIDIAPNKAVSIYRSITSGTKDFYRSSPEELGKKLNTYARIICAFLVLVFVYAMDLATIMYRAGYALGTWMHSLNNAITNAVVRKSTQSFSKIQEETSRAWQLSLPLPKSIGDWLSATSDSTTASSNGKAASQQLSVSTKSDLNSVDQKKEDGITNVDTTSEQLASSQGSKPSEKLCTSTSRQSKTSKKNTTTSVGVTSVSTSTQSTAKTTQRRGRTTAKPKLK